MLTTRSAVIPHPQIPIRTAGQALKNPFLIAARRDSKAVQACIGECQFPALLRRVSMFSVGLEACLIGSFC